MSQVPVIKGIQAKLQAAFAPARLEIIDESAQHYGHAGYHPEGHSHLRIIMASAAFDGLSRLERQRQVYAVLAEEMAGRVHALALELHGTN